MHIYKFKGHKQPYSIFKSTLTIQGINCLFKSYYASTIDYMEVPTSLASLIKCKAFQGKEF